MTIVCRFMGLCNIFFSISTNQWSLLLQRNNIIGWVCYYSKEPDYCPTPMHLFKKIKWFYFLDFFFTTTSWFCTSSSRGKDLISAEHWYGSSSSFLLLVGVLSRLPFARYVAWWGHLAASETPGHFPSEEQQCFDLWESSLSTTRVRSCFPGSVHGVVFSCPLCVHCINTALQL